MTCPEGWAYTIGSMRWRFFQVYERRRLLRVNLDVAATGLCAVFLSLAPYLAMTEAAGIEHRALLVLIAAVIVGTFELTVHILGRLLVGPMQRVWMRLGFNRWSRGRAFFGDRGLGWRERVSFTALAYGLGCSAMYYGLALGLPKVLALALAFSGGMVFARAAHAMWLLQNRAFSLYQRRRVVNINVNVVASGMLAIVLAKGPVMLIGNLIPDEHDLLFTLVATLIDGAFDICLYYGFHWYTNHRLPLLKNRGKPGRTGPRRRSFFKDASLIQFERVLLSPVYYGIAIGLTYTLIQLDVDRSWSFVIGFMTGMLVTRVLHTVIGLKTGTFRDDLESLGLVPESESIPVLPRTDSATKADSQPEVRDVESDEATEQSDGDASSSSLLTDEHSPADGMGTSR